MKRSGFTLIELLVVIAIVILLAALLFPVLASATRKAQQTRCALQLRQIGQAIQLYTMDHDDYPPPGGYEYRTLPPSGTPTTNAPAPPSVRMHWQDILLSTAYVRDQAILICPAAPSPEGQYAYRYSYGANGWLMPWEGAVNMTTVADPAATLIVTEKIGYDWVAWPPGSQANNPYYLPLDPRHEQRLNILYADGHVRAETLPELIRDPHTLWH